MSRRLAALFVALSAAAALLGGCADGKVKEANDYVDAVNAAQTRFAKTSEQLLADVQPGGAAKKNGAALSRFYGAVDSFVAELRRIKPPTRVASLHERLIGAVVTFGGELRRAGSAITSDNASKILAGQERLAKATSTISQRLNSTVSAINDALRK